jgi:hypothetical protein
MSARPFVWGLIVLLLSAGCSSGTRTVRVAVPPRVDLHAYPMVGLVTFTSNGKGELDRLSTERFLAALQAAQPGTRVVELGTEAQVLASVNRNSWDAGTLRAIKETRGVDVIVMGRLDVEKAKTDFQVSAMSMLKSMSVRQDVNAALSARLVETGTGATMWTNGAKMTANVANADVSNRGGSFGASDPQAAYGEMVDGLVFRVTDDFRVHYVTRRVPRDQTVVASVGE